MQSLFIFYFPLLVFTLSYAWNFIWFPHWFLLQCGTKSCILIFIKIPTETENHMSEEMNQKENEEDPDTDGENFWPWHSGMFFRGYHQSWFNPGTYQTGKRSKKFYFGGLRKGTHKTENRHNLWHRHKFGWYFIIRHTEKSCKARVLTKRTLTHSLFSMAHPKDICDYPSLHKIFSKISPAPIQRGR